MADMTVALEMSGADKIADQMARMSETMRDVTKQFGGVQGRGRVNQTFSGDAEGMQKMNAAMDELRQLAKQGNMAVGPAQITRTATGEMNVQADVRARQPNEKLVAGMTELREGMTNLVPGGSIINSFEKSGLFVGIATGIVAIGAAMKSIVQGSQVYQTMIGTVMKTLSVAVDVMLAPFMPIAAKIAVWIIQHLMPKMQTIGEFVSGSPGGAITAVGAGIVGYVGLKMAGSALSTAATSFGSTILSKIIGGGAGEAIGGATSEALEAGVKRRGIGRLIGSAIGGFITVPKRIFTAIGRGIGGAITLPSKLLGGAGTNIGTGIAGHLGNANVISKILPIGGAVAIAGAMGIAMWQRYKQVQKDDDVLKGMTQIEQLGHLQGLGVDESVAKKYMEIRQDKGLDSSKEMVENFALFANMEKTMSTFGSGLSGVDQKYQDQFQGLAPQWKEFFRDEYLKGSSMDQSAITAIKADLTSLIDTQNKVLEDTIIMSGDLNRINSGMDTVAKERPMRGGYMGKAETARRLQEQMGLTAQDVNVVDLGQMGFGTLQEKRQKALNTLGTMNTGEAGFNPNLMQSNNVLGETTIYIQNAEQKLPQDVVNYLELLAKSENIRLGPELVARYDQLSNQP